MLKLPVPGTQYVVKLTPWRIINLFQVNLFFQINIFYQVYRRYTELRFWRDGLCINHTPPPVRANAIITLVRVDYLALFIVFIE
jgi:hypothetical protein